MYKVPAAAWQQSAVLGIHIGIFVRNLKSKCQPAIVVFTVCVHHCRVIAAAAALCPVCMSSH